MENKGSQNAKDQVGFCGIWCGSCPAGNGAIVELTRKYEELIKKWELEKWVPKGFDFKEFAKGLACIQTMSLCPGCRKGGGGPSCRVRLCALGKGLDDCSQCDQIIECKNFDQLETSNPKIKTDLMKIKNVDQKELVKAWTSELQTKWPHCILSCTATRKQ